MRPVLLLLLLLPASDCFCRLPRVRSRLSPLRRAASFAALADNSTVIVPDTFPSFGLSERQLLRLSYMIRRDEPLIQEVMGLQFASLAIGSQHSFVGGVLGCMQFAPMISFWPGRVGDAIRTVGYRVFVVVVAIFEAIDRLWRHAQALRSALAAKWHTREAPRSARPVVMSAAAPEAAGVRRRSVRDALGGTARRVRRLLPRRRRREEEWPAVGGSVRYHCRAGLRPPAQPRELWTPPPGWQPPSKPL